MTDRPFDTHAYDQGYRDGKHEAAAEIDRLRAALVNCRVELDDYYMREYRSDDPIIQQRLEEKMASNPARVALTGQPSAPVEPWQSIKTQPSQTMKVLLFSPDQYDPDWDGADYGIRVGYYSKGEWREQGTNHDAFEFDNPTHWMPLPAAPHWRGSDD